MFSGDGGFMFNSSELATAVKYGINVTTVLFRNDSYGNVANDMDEAFSGAYETDLATRTSCNSPSHLAQSGSGRRQLMDLEKLIPEALELNAPVVIDVPFTGMRFPRAPQFAPFYSLPWTMPQEGLIPS